MTNGAPMGFLSIERDHAGGLWFASFVDMIHMVDPTTLRVQKSINLFQGRWWIPPSTCGCKQFSLIDRQGPTGLRQCHSASSG